MFSYCYINILITITGEHISENTFKKQYNVSSQMGKTCRSTHL